MFWLNFIQWRQRAIHRALILNIEGARHQYFKKIRCCGFYFVQYNINTIKQYSRQHHPASSAINTLLLSVSFKPTFIDFAHVLNMLALSVVFIFFFSSLCILLDCHFEALRLYVWCLRGLLHCVCVCKVYERLYLVHASVWLLAVIVLKR